MESEEIDSALEDLEVRLERLRALYEQYFLGFEKIEPQVARKDVDRRIYTLRRAKIRNTGRRFKLQTIIQRYNTFQQYWQRICREIENGTYRRHVLRAEKRVGPSNVLTTAARRRFGKQLASTPPPDEISELDDDAATLLDAPEDEAATLPPGPPARAPMASRPETQAPPLPPRSPMASRPDTQAPPLPPRPPMASRPDTQAPPLPPRRPMASRPDGDAPPPPRPPMQSRPESGPGRPPPPPPRRPPTGVPAPRSPEPLSDQVVRELQTKFNAAAQTANQPAVTLERMRASLEATRENMRARHGDRRVDFDIVVKNGRPVLKPIIR